MRELSFQDLIEAAREQVKGLAAESAQGNLALTASSEGRERWQGTDAPIRLGAKAILFAAAAVEAVVNSALIAQIPSIDDPELRRKTFEQVYESLKLPFAEKYAQVRELYGI